MKTMTLVVGTHVFRWAGGAFVAVWRSERMDEHVPDDMIGLPDSLNRSRVTHEDIQCIARDYVTAD